MKDFTKKQYKQMYGDLLEQKQTHIHLFAEIRNAIGAVTPDRFSMGCAPETVLNAIMRLIKIGKLIPFTERELDEWGNDIWNEMLKTKSRPSASTDTHLVESSREI